MDEEEDINICPELIKPIEYPAEPPDCFLCWKFNEAVPRQRIKLKNPKYCRLYPNYGQPKLKRPIPNFDHCKTLYTKCDYMLEQCVHEQFLKIEKEFKAYHQLLEQQMKVQNELLEDMVIQCYRFQVLTRAGVCVKLYPEVVSKNTENRASCQFHKNLRSVNESNCVLTLSIKNIRDSFAELKKRYNQLDMTVDSPFIKGSLGQKSVTYVKHLLEDMFQHFYGSLCKMKCWAELLHIEDIVSVQDYLILIKKCNKYENNLIEYLDDCHCMRNKRKECIEPHINNVQKCTNKIHMNKKIK